MESAEPARPADPDRTGSDADRRKHILIGSAVVFFISLGVIIPALGLFIGWIFTLGGGFAGGATVGYLRKRGASDGAKYGFIVALAGGIPSSIVGVILGTVLNFIVLSSEPGGGDSTEGLAVIAVIGFLSGILFKVIGGVVGGGFVGGLTDQTGD